MNDARRRNHTILLVLIVIALIGTAFVPNHTQASWIPRNQLIWEIADDPDSIDPHVSSKRFGKWVVFNVYETLYTYPWGEDDVEPLVPLLASDIPDISPDGMSYIVRLREDIVFHDGFPLQC